MNGIRMWCVDDASGSILHLGGEYTWGNCEAVGACFEQIVAEYLPTGETAPHVVFLTDGMEWLRTWIGPVLPKDTIFILDFYHAAEHLAAYARERFGVKSKEGAIGSGAKVAKPTKLTPQVSSGRSYDVVASPAA